MFNIVRLVMGCIFFVCFAIMIKAKCIHKHILNIALISISVVLTIVLSFLPFENLFVTFDSPKEAYEYYNFGKSNIELIVEGNNCDFVVDCKNKTETYLIIPKTANGWKIGIGLNTKRIIQKISKGIVVYVYQYKNTNDYFITVLNTNGGGSKVSDYYNSEFHSLERSNVLLKKTFVTYYAHISDFNPQYRLVVDGNEIVLRD